MNTDILKNIQGKNIEILEMTLTNLDNRLELSWKIYFDNTFSSIIFYNVSRFRMEDFSAPLEVHGFEIVTHAQNGWEKDSKYEICDFENNRVNFFCEHFKIDNL